MNVWRNIKVLSCKHCYRGKAISITYSECVCILSYVVCKAHAPCYIVIWVVLLCNLCCVYVFCVVFYVVLFFYAMVHFLCYCILSLCYCTLLFYCAVHCYLFFFLLCMCTWLYILYFILPPGVNPIAVNKYLCTSTLAATYFSTISHERHDFWKKVTQHKMCAFIFSTNLFETLLILRINQGDIVISVKMSSCKILVILVTF
jgi:hypothetical protein